MKPSDTKLWIVALIALGAAQRLAPHPWNASPLIAIALFSGALLPRPWAIAVPLAGMFLSDLFLGWHATLPFTWLGIALIALGGTLLRQRRGPLRIAAASLGGSALFFLLSNFGVWLLTSMYPRTAEGLLACYTAGVPFARTGAIGDLVYSAALFGGYALAFRRAPKTAEA